MNSNEWIPKVLKPLKKFSRLLENSISRLEIYISSLKMYISSLEIHISRLEIEFSNGIGNFSNSFWVLKKTAPVCEIRA